MQHSNHAALFALCALVLWACSTPAPPPPPAVAASEQQAPGKVTRQSVIEVSATVEAIDYDTRMVTLRGSDGRTVTFRADDSVRRLNEVKKGDVVQATYYQAVAINLRKPGQAQPGVSAAGMSGRAEPGEPPAAAGARSVTIVATVRALDREKQTATLETPDGELKTIAVRNPQHFDVAAVGDLVEITYTEAVAISVEKPGRK
jgi:hypothetical protein